MLTIRLQRVGKKKQPVFRIVLAEKHRAASKLAKEVLGFYNPRTKDFGLRSEERMRYWIEKHVEISPTVYNLLVDKGLLAGKKQKAWRPKVKKAEGAKPASEAPKAQTAEETSKETTPAAEAAPLKEEGVDPKK